MKLALQLLLAVSVVLVAGRKSTRPPAVAERNQSLKILTYNIHHGEGTDGKLDLERIAGIIKASGADLVALQEVDRYATRSGNVDQAAILGRLTGLHPAFGAAMPFQGGHYGQAILSRDPIQKYTVHPLPQQTGREPRIALQARIGGLLFVSTHLDHQLEPIRVAQAGKLQQLLGTNTIPVILAGDFNAAPTNQTMQALSGWTDAAGPNGQPTIPSEQPRRRIDYILLRPAPAWTVREVKVLEEPVASDHRPVLATVELHPK